MSRFYSHINTALRVLATYKGDQPFSMYMKHFFSKEKKYGSRDRKQITALCYGYLRVGLALNKKLTEETVLQAFFLTHTGQSELIQQLQPGWSAFMNATVEKKIQLLDGRVSLATIFPFINELSSTIDAELFCKSFLLQPDVFIRIRPRQKEAVINKIIKAGIEHRFLHNDTCAQFPVATKIESFLEPDKEVVIQDYNSQRVLDYVSSHREDICKEKNKPLSIWDCCAASGGKSILIHDLLQQPAELTVSDIRQSSMANCKERLNKASITNYHHFVADSSKTGNDLPSSLYDIIICDAPCTGSGTWSRTPEQLYFFDPASINTYAALQKKIAGNVLSNLKKDGLFFYITCSVFTKENEEVAAFIQQLPNMQLLEMKNLYGYTIKADSMFVAVFKKTNCEISNKASGI